MDSHVVQDMSPEDWNNFVRDVAAGHAITSHDVPTEMWGMVFMPLALGGLNDWTEEELSQIGCLWERYSEAGPYSANGYPAFMSMHIISKRDWERAVPEINRRRAVLRGEDPEPGSKLPDR